MIGVIGRIWRALSQPSPDEIDRRRVAARQKERADLFKRWQNHEPGLIGCQECGDVIKDQTPIQHDCRFPNEPIMMMPGPPIS